MCRVNFLRNRVLFNPGQPLVGCDEGFDGIRNASRVDVPILPGSLASQSSGP